MAYNGQFIKTSNADVAAAPNGTTFVKDGGYLRVTSVPAPVFKVGDRVRVVSKGRTATLVRMTDVQGLSDGMPPLSPKGEKQFFYIGDAEPTVVRVAAVSDLRTL